MFKGLNFLTLFSTLDLLIVAIITIQTQDGTMKRSELK